MSNQYKSTQALADLLGVARTNNKPRSNQNKAKNIFNALTSSVDALTDKEQEAMERLAIDLMLKGLVNNQRQAIERARKEIVATREKTTGRTSNQRYHRLGWNN